MKDGWRRAGSMCAFFRGGVIVATLSLISDGPEEWGWSVARWNGATTTGLLLPCYGTVASKPLPEAEAKAAAEAALTIGESDRADLSAAWLSRWMALAGAEVDLAGVPDPVAAWLVGQGAPYDARPRPLGRRA